MRLEYVEPGGEVDSEGDTITDGCTAVCGPGTDRVARSADSTRFELVTSGGHQLQPVVRPGKLGQFARWRGCSSLTSAVAASVSTTRSVAQLALGTGCDAGWGRVGTCRARWLTRISSLSAAGFQEMRPARAPA
jgi:hypothetical protein